MNQEDIKTLANQAGMSHLSLIDIGYLEAFANLIMEKAAWTHQLTRIIDLHTENAALKEQVAQQATVIEQMRNALHLAANNMNYVGAKNWDVIANALLLQPSPEILQTRDDRVAAACAEMLRNKELPFEIDAWVEATKRDVSSMTALALAALVDSGEWRKYL